MDIDELIEYEVEHTGLDFKAIQYKKDAHHELLKDIIAMANATIEGDKLIVIGVKKKPDNTFTIHPIPEAEFVDSAIYQRLVLDKIEPDLYIEYLPHLYKGAQLVGVLKIPSSPDKPYMMKDLYSHEKGVRKKGESFIRKGTTTSALMRKDIDRMFEKKSKADAFNHQITSYFSGTQRDKVLAFQPVTVSLPSWKQTERVKAIIAKKEQKEKEQEKLANDKQRDTLFDRNFSNINSFKLPPLFARLESTPYENRSLETLREDLVNIPETYREDDNYELFEKKSEKINITILNEGTKYLEDAVVEVQIPEIKGLFIADRVYKKPVNNSHDYSMNIEFDSKNTFYPTYQRQNGFYVLSEGLGNLRHLRPVDVFHVPLRITILPILEGSEIEIKLTVFGKNLPTPIKDTLLLKVNQ